jgi:ABC-2 type transport system permease protein
MNRFLVLTGTELRLVVRNRTAAVTAILVPVALGILWARTIPNSVPHKWATVVSLQLAVVFAMSIYIAATGRLVIHRQNQVLKRLRTTGMTDATILAGTVAPSAVVGLAQLVAFAVVDTASGMGMPDQPEILAIALLGGLATIVTAALVTASITTTPERAQITTMPLTFVLLGGSAAVGALSSDALRAGLSLVPGLSIGTLTQLAFSGRVWSEKFAGVPLSLIATFTIVLWPIVFGLLAAKRFQWEQRT